MRLTLFDLSSSTISDRDDILPTMEVNHLWRVFRDEGILILLLDYVPASLAPLHAL